METIRTERLVHSASKTLLRGIAGTRAKSLQKQNHSVTVDKFWTHSVRNEDASMRQLLDKQVIQRSLDSHTTIPGQPCNDAWADIQVLLLPHDAIYLVKYVLLHYAKRFLLAQVIHHFCGPQSPTMRKDHETSEAASRQYKRIRASTGGLSARAKLFTAWQALPLCYIHIMSSLSATKLSGPGIAL